MSIIKGTNQIVAGYGGTKRSIGEVYFSQSSLATDNSGALPLFTGETIASANTIYPDFYNWVLAHTELQCTSAEYESALSTYGECPKYVIGGGSLRLPKLSNYIKAANTAEGITQKEAGLPDHKHLLTNTTSDLYTHYGTTNIYSVKDNGKYTNQAREKIGYASESNPIYGKSSTVTPAHTTLYPWVVAYTAAIPASTAQAAEFQQGLSGKADTSLANLSTTGKSVASGLGMPSNRYIDLTVAASSSSYTAPANGYFVVRVPFTGNQACSLFNTTTLVGINLNSNGGWTAYGNIPVKKNDVVQLWYNCTPDLFRFVYAEGDK